MIPIRGPRHGHIASPLDPRRQMPQELERQERHIAGDHERHGRVAGTERRMYAAERTSVRYHVRDDAQAGRAKGKAPSAARGSVTISRSSTRLTQHGKLSLEDREAVDVEACSCRGRASGGRDRPPGSPPRRCVGRRAASTSRLGKAAGGDTPRGGDVSAAVTLPENERTENRRLLVIRPASGHRGIDPLAAGVLRELAQAARPAAARQGHRGGLVLRGAQLPAARGAARLLRT